MRTKFSDEVEKCREVGEQLPGSHPGDDYGLFWLRHPWTCSRLKAIVCGSVLDKGIDWEHVSVSSVRRVPTWDEMCWVKGLFFSSNETVVQYHPRARDYVNYHPNCLHMWRWCGGAFPTPPRQCV